MECRIHSKKMEGEFKHILFVQNCSFLLSGCFCSADTGKLVRVEGTITEAICKTILREICWGIGADIQDAARARATLIKECVKIDWPKFRTKSKLDLVADVKTDVHSI